MQHKPVLLAEALDALAIKADGIYLDGTFGRGGHAQEILNRLAEAGRLIAMDKDPEAIQIANQKFGHDKRFSIIHDSFANMRSHIEQENLLGKVDGILLDLGVSSPQLDDATRGFSFLQSGPLDMRMNPEVGSDAAMWIKQASQQDMAEVFKKYGEERFAKRIAKAIVEARAQQPIVTTDRLAEIVKAANPAWEKHKHPATRVFQAIRIFINHELDDLQQGLEQSLDVLATNGRLVVISFHSLEDRIVKRFMRKHTQGELPAKLPVTHEQLRTRLAQLSKAIKPSQAELDNNPRARSAILRSALRRINRMETSNHG